MCDDPIRYIVSYLGAASDEGVDARTLSFLLAQTLAQQEGEREVGQKAGRDQAKNIESLCWNPMHYAPGGSVDGLILIEVDDLAIGTKRMQEAEFQQRFQAAFRFGKWEKREAIYIYIYVLVDQENTFWRNCTLYFCVRNSRKTEGSHWMNSVYPFTCV